MKKILIVTYDMVPYAFTWGGCQRMYYLAQALLKHGITVDVLALRKSKYNTYGKDPLPRVIFAQEPANNLEESGISDNSTTGIINGVKGMLREIAFKMDPILFNEITPGNGLQAYGNYARAKEKLRKQVSENEYDLVIVSAPPFVLFNTIALIKKERPGIKIVMDYRDPWNSWHTGNKLCECREKKFQKLADCIVCTNQALCDDMSNKYNISATKYHVVENGFMTEKDVNKENVEVCLSHDKLNIVYTGAIGFWPKSDGYRDTTMLFGALEDIIKAGNNSIRLVFIGEANSDEEYLDYLNKKFTDNLLIIGKVNSTVAKEYVRQADACLLLHTADDLSGKFLISGKAYDYIQERKYIFSISREDSQHANLLRKHGIGINVPNEKSEIEKGLQIVYGNWKNGIAQKSYKELDVALYSREYQLKKYLKIIDNLI